MIFGIQPHQRHGGFSALECWEHKSSAKIPPEPKMQRQPLLEPWGQSMLNHSGTVKALRHPEMRKDRSTTEKKPKERSCVTRVLQRFQTTSLVSRAGWLFLSPNCSFRGKPWASDSEPRCGRRRASLPPQGQVV